MKNITNNTEAIDDTTNEGAPVAPSPLDSIAAALNSRAARVTLAILAGLVVVAGVIGAAASVYSLQAGHMKATPVVAGFNAALVALMPLALALGAAQASRTRTRAALVMWLTVWIVAGLALAALYGVLNAAAVVVNVEALTSTGRVLAPLPGALAVATVAALLPTLRGADDDDALSGLWSLAAKTVLIGYSSFGLLNVAMQSATIVQQAYGVMLAVVVEVSFIALLSRKTRGALASALLVALSAVIGLNAAESTVIGLGFNLPDALAWIPVAGQVSIVLSGSVCVAVAVALSVKTGKTARPVTVADWLAARVADVQAVRAALPERAPAPPRRASVALAAESDAPVADLEDATPATGAEVRPVGRKSRR